MGNQKKDALLSWLMLPARLPAMIAMAAVIVAVLVFAMLQIGGNNSQEPEVTTESSLKKIIEISELDTFTSVYNGIATVMDEKNPEKVDYYVSYEAEVFAGIDFDEIAIDVDEESKTILIDLPDAKINNASVDVTSLDFMFFDNKANASTVTAEALKACEEDVNEESKKQNAIFELAQENAENVVKALVEPIVEQLGEGYKVTVE